MEQLRHETRKLMEENEELKRKVAMLEELLSPTLNEPESLKLFDSVEAF